MEGAAGDEGAREVAEEEEGVLLDGGDQRGKVTLACRKVESVVLSEDCLRSTWITRRRLIIKYSKKLT